MTDDRGSQPLPWLHALERTNHAVDRAIAAALADIDLPYLDAHAILVIAEHGTIPLSEVRSGLGRRGSTMTAVIDRLERRGFMRRRTGEDRRAFELEVTEAGLRAADLVRTRLAIVEGAIRDRLGAAAYPESIAALLEAGTAAARSLVDERAIARGEEA